MKISILSPNLSSNSVGRAYLLSKLLENRYEVTIIGPIFGDGIWEPLEYDNFLSYHGIKSRSSMHFFSQAVHNLDEIGGDLIYVHKPLLTSFGIGLLKKVLSRKPLILDIDDWEMGFIRADFTKPRSRYDSAFSATALLLQTLSRVSTWVFESLTFLANEITVSNHYLRKRFGGTIIWHARDTDLFDPRNFNRNVLRKKYDLGGDKKVIIFFGTPRAHKGIEDLIDAVAKIGTRNAVLFLVGMDKSSYSKYVRTIANERLSKRCRIFGVQPFYKIPEMLAISDLVVIPQRKNSSTIGQMPAKVFDAMAMAKPIIATRVCDLPEVLEGCGWVVDSGNPEQLSDTIEYILTHSVEAEEMGWKAREKCIKMYSFHSARKTLHHLLKKYE